MRGRPKKDQDKREYRLYARFTKSEYEVIQRVSITLGINKTDLVRMRVLDNTNTIVVNAQELISQLDSVGTELGRTGNNINQLSKYANTMLKRGVLSEGAVRSFNDLMQQYLQQRSELAKAIRKISRQMCK